MTNDQQLPPPLPYHRVPDHLPRPVVVRPFRHPADTPAFANETVWRYARDPKSGKQVHEPRVPVPTYTLRCFVLTRLVKLFHAHVRFEPTFPPLSLAEYRERVRVLLGRSARTYSAPEKRLVFPAFPDLRSFSRAHESLLKEEAGGAWRSYFRRGHWRMIAPFLRRGQAREARRMRDRVRQGRAVSVHVVTFPQLTLNHALVLFAVTETETELRFEAYDPNLPDESVPLTFNGCTRRFSLPPLPYFIGGPINAFEVDCGFWR